jgi:hypothetical protein
MKIYNTKGPVYSLAGRREKMTLHLIRLVKEIEAKKKTN